MTINRVETHIAQVKRHVSVGQWGAEHGEVQKALDEARQEYLARTPDPMITEVPDAAIRVVPANGEVVVLFTIENPKPAK